MQAVFFDLDKTVIARSSTLAFGKPLMREGLIGRAQVVKALYAQIVYHLVGADETKMEKMRVALLETTRGWDKEQVERIARETITEIVDPLIYTEALQLIHDHQAAGRRVYIVSSSAEEIVRPLAEYLEIPHYIATKPSIDEDNKYTGALDFYCYGEHKAVAIRREAAQHGIDLAESYAYSDSITDAPMLEAVGHPHAVNPDRELRALATGRDWPILEFARPVSLRTKIAAVPKPSPTAALAAGTLVAALLAWATRRRRTEPPAA